MKFSAPTLRRLLRVPGIGFAWAMACSGSISDPGQTMDDGSFAEPPMDADPSEPSPVDAQDEALTAEPRPVPPTETPSAMVPQPADAQTSVPPEQPTPVAQPPVEVEVCDAFGIVLQPRCGDSDCHRGVGIGSFGLSEEQAVSYVDKAPVSNAPICGLMIDSANPERSFILTKVTGGAPYNEDDCKDLMPIGRPLPQSEIDCLRSWLQQFQQ